MCILYISDFFFFFFIVLWSIYPLSGEGSRVKTKKLDFICVHASPAAELLTTITLMSLKGRFLREKKSENHHDGFFRQLVERVNAILNVADSSSRLYKSEWSKSINI
jgi:hypothetical protein